MPTISTLPPELLYLTLELGAEEKHDRFRFLCRSALVCRAWRAPSQSLLWQWVKLMETEDLLRFLTSGVYDLPTMTLKLEYDEITGSQALAVVRACTGLRNVQLGPRLSSPRDFCLPIFAGITSLSAPCDFDFDLPSTETLHLPFQLSHLYLEPSSQSFSAPFITALLQQSTLTSLEFLPHFPSKRDFRRFQREVLPLLVNLAPQLIRLSVDVSHLSGLAQGTLRDVWRRCVRLRHLEAYANGYEFILPHLPVPLKSLAIFSGGYSEESIIPPLLSFLRSAAVCSKLEELELLGVAKLTEGSETATDSGSEGSEIDGKDDGGDSGGGDAGSELGRLCEERGIKLRIEQY